MMHSYEGRYPRFERGFAFYFLLSDLLEPQIEKTGSEEVLEFMDVVIKDMKNVLSSIFCRLADSEVEGVDLEEETWVNSRVQRLRRAYV